VYRTVEVQFDDGIKLTCWSPSSLAIHRGDQCIVEVDRVPEFGRILRFVEVNGDSAMGDRMPKVVRCATLQDQAKAHENALMNKMARETCSAKIRKLGLPMRLVRTRYSFDRAVLAVLFTAETNVDYRDLVKALAGELRTRVEMKQIGVRDEAGMLGGMGPCGRRLCCADWLRSFASVNVKMAKVQRLSLNPTSIGGMCGRLKCCLRYEDDTYRKLDRNLPRDGVEVECSEGTGCVVDKDVLSQIVKVRLDEGRIVECGVNDIKKLAKDRPPNARRRKHEDTGSERA
jgi:cell fate regulator YaaT (PSP1 superfamily)